MTPLAGEGLGISVHTLGADRRPPQLADHTRVDTASCKTKQNPIKLSNSGQNSNVEHLGNVKLIRY